MSTTVLTEIIDNVLIITLNRPDKKNAFNVEMLDAWVAALEEGKQNNEVHVIVLTGFGDAFCAGGDLQDIQEINTSTPLDSKNILWTNVHRIPLALRDMDKPIISVINGVAIGAGMDMALMTDIRLMADTAKISEGYVKMGLVSGDGGAYFLPKIVGEAKAFELLWTGDFIDAQEAHRLQIVSYVYPKELLMDKALELAKKIAEGPQIPIRMMKRIVKKSHQLDVETALDLISSQFALAQNTSDHKEAVSAFLEKRKPSFIGR